MIQGSELIPESLRIAGWIGGAGFTVWIFKMAYEMFRGSNKKNGNEKNCDIKDGKRPACMDSVPWALHAKTTEELKECAKQTVELQRQTLTALHRLADAGEAQTTAIQNLGEKLPKLP